MRSTRIPLAGAFAGALLAGLGLGLFAAASAQSATRTATRKTRVNRKPTADWKLQGNLRDSRHSVLSLEQIGAPKFKRAKVGRKRRKVLAFDDLQACDGSLPATAENHCQGLRLSGVPEAAQSTYSLEVYCAITAFPDYERILSFGPNDTDDGLYLSGPDEEPPAGNLDLYPEVNAGEAVVAPRQWVRIRVTREATSQEMHIYVNGAERLTYTDSGDLYLLRQGQVVFFVDDYDESAAGSVAGIRFWDRVVSP